VVEVDVAADGRFTGSPRTDKGFVKDALRQRLPTFLEKGETADGARSPR
jgi:hypothetical protein